LAKHLPNVLRNIYHALPQLRARVPAATFAALVPLLDPKVDGDRVIIETDLESTGGGMQLITILATALQEQIRRNSNSNSFKQILLAIHNYYDVYKSFPPRMEVRDENGKSGLSWRVHLLPFLEQNQLYEQFHLDEPWDSPHNKRLIKSMPPVFDNKLLGVKPGHTTFLAPVGEGTVFGGDKPAKFRNITDGTSNTVILVEVKRASAVPWTAPKDYEFDPADPGRELFVDADERFLAGFADGSVQKLRKNVEPNLLLRLFQMGDGHPINRNELR
jgi:hypothetical protein